jgi:hypothetical protein
VTALLVAGAMAGCAAAPSAPPPLEVLLEPGYRHLGDDQTTDWGEAPAAPETGPLVLAFEARAVDHESVLVIHQRHVNDAWTIRLNETVIGELLRHDDRRRARYVVPPGVLRDGPNTLAIESSTTTDDVTLGDIRLHLQPLTELYDLQPVALAVTDAETGAPLPARVTITTPGGEPAELFGTPTRGTAVRSGTLYVGPEAVSFQLPRGEYVAYATRGSEWSLARTDFTADEATAGGPAEVALSLRREVDTTGFIAADTHIHTVTFSGHGDASIEERMVTLAGEGVELAVSTDHNHNTDYRPWQREAGLEAWFTPVTGNEVTTENGHFNAFPLDPEDEVPEWKLSDWVALVDGMRAKGARAVVLNHPRWPSREKGPYGVYGLDTWTGGRAGGGAFTFDAMELVNATDHQVDPLLLFRDWFALLDRGETIVAVGTSDSHTVGDPVGQGRTYVVSSTDDPAAIDIGEVSDSIAAGRSSISLGFFVDIAVDEAFGPADMVPAADGRVTVALRIAAASWIRPAELRVYCNGAPVLERSAPLSEGGPLDTTLVFEVVTPPNDAWLVCVVTGEDVDGPWWPSLNPYTLAATNPVWLDVDGDGAWASPRATAEARRTTREAGGEPLDDPVVLVGLDDAAALQYLDLLRESDGAQAVRRAAAERAATSTRVAGYLASLPAD